MSKPLSAFKSHQGSVKVVGKAKTETPAPTGVRHEWDAHNRCAACGQVSRSSAERRKLDAAGCGR